MSEHLLFIDIEASGLPKRWDLPYSATDNWPCAVQVSWIVCDRNGELLKEENQFIADGSFSLCKKAQKIHGLSKEFLLQHGRPRSEVLALLKRDLETYTPLVVGHFIELDFHVLSADFHRVGEENPMKSLPLFCTMLATRHRVRNPAKKYLRLAELYDDLFQKPFPNQHDAVADARATLECFFELQKRKEINPDTDHRKEIIKTASPAKRSGCGLFALGFITLTLLAFLL